MKKKALILTWDGFSDEELVYAFYRLQEDGFEVDIFSNKISTKTDPKPLKGVNGISFHSSGLVENMGSGMLPVYLQLYDLLIIPGGVKALEKLRMQKTVIDLVSAWNSTGKVIGSICWGAQILISAKAVKGREISGYYSLKIDIENAGGIYVDKPAVISDNIVSTAHYKDLGYWMRSVLDVYYEKNK